MIKRPALVHSHLKPQPRRRGLTLLEVIISLLLTTTIVLVSVTASANLYRNQAVSADEHLARELAFQILDEVTSTDFQDGDNDRVFGNEASESTTNRSAFDDVDDYDGYTASPPTHRDGSTIVGLENWSLSVSVSKADTVASGIVASTADDAPLRLVTVTCTSPAGAVSSESMLVSEVPSNIPDNTSFDKWRHLQLTFPDQRKVDVVAPLRNQPYTITAY